MVSQVLVDCALAAAEVLGKAATDKLDDQSGCDSDVVEAVKVGRTGLLHFAAALIGEGRVTLTGRPDK
jgi:hypothetical protein